MFFFSSPPPLLGQNYCAVNNGGCTHLCLATPVGRACKCPDNAAQVGCVERDGGYWEERRLHSWESTLVGCLTLKTEPLSIIKLYSCWKCHWKPGVNLLCLYAYLCPLCSPGPPFIKSQLPLRLVNRNTIVIIMSFYWVHINWEQNSRDDII